MAILVLMNNNITYIQILFNSVLVMLSPQIEGL